MLETSTHEFKKTILMRALPNHPPINAKPRTNLSCSSQACLTLEDMGEEAMDEIPLRPYCSLPCIFVQFNSTTEQRQRSKHSKRDKIYQITLAATMVFPRKRNILVEQLGIESL